MADAQPTNLYDIEVKTLAGEPYALDKYRGKVLLVVNTASKCGFTPQYAGLETLHEKFKDREVVVLGFPCNQFGAQEPGGSDDIASFCQQNYGVTFPMHEKIEVNGDGAHPLYRLLTAERPGVFGTQRIKWNFTKFLIDQQGRVHQRYAPTTTPAAIESDIESLLARESAAE